MVGTTSPKSKSESAAAAGTWDLGVEEFEEDWGRSKEHSRGIEFVAGEPTIEATGNASDASRATLGTTHSQ